MDRVYKMFLLGRNFVYGVPWTKPKKPLKPRTLNIFLKNLVFPVLLSVCNNTLWDGSLHVTCCIVIGWQICKGSQPQSWWRHIPARDTGEGSLCYSYICI